MAMTEERSVIQAEIGTDNLYGTCSVCKRAFVEVLKNSEIDPAESASGENRIVGLHYCNGNICHGGGNVPLDGRVYDLFNQPA